MQQPRIIYEKPTPDRTDLSVITLLTEGKWQQALILIENANKKKKHWRHKLNKALILLTYAEARKAHEGWITLTMTILNPTNTPFTDIEALETIEASVPALLHGDRCTVGFLTQMWKRAADAKPLSEQINDLWYRSEIKRREYAMARQVAMRGLKAFDSKHIFLYRAIVSSTLDTTFGTLEQNKKISAAMACKYGAESHKATPSGGANATTTKASKSLVEGDYNKVDKTSISMQNSSDVEVVVHAFREQEKYSQALALLDDESNVGLRSEIGRGNWQLARMRIDLLKKTDNHQGLWTFCYQLLCDAAKLETGELGSEPYNYGTTGDDMEIWFTFIMVTISLGDEKHTEKLHELMSCDGLQKRHRLLANIDYICKLKEDDWPKLETAFKEYLNQYLHTDIAYGDLRTAAASLTAEQRSKLLELAQGMVKQPTEQMKENKKRMKRYFHSILTAYKLEYTFKLTASYNTFDDINGTERFATKCLKLYEESLLIDSKHNITDRRLGDEAAILAAACFIHLQSATGTPDAHYQAIMILERLLEHSRHHYGGIYLLIRLYLTHGVWNRAFELYQRLDIKNLQIFGESWVLLTRIATVYPYKNGAPNQELHKMLLHYVDYVDSKDTEDLRPMSAFEDHDNFAAISYFQETLSICSDSLTKAMNRAELSRLHHRHQIGDEYDKPTMVGITSSIEPRLGDWMDGNEFTDLRVRSGFPNYDAYDVPFLDQHVSIGPQQDEIWVRAEDLAIKWYRYFQTRYWTDYEVSEAQALRVQMYEDEVVGYVQLIDKPDPAFALTEVELHIACLLSAMAAVQEAESVIRQSSANAMDEGKFDEFDWFHLRYFALEYQWSVLTPCIARFVAFIDTTSKKYKEHPLEEFSKQEWLFLHKYYKLTEGFPLLAKFLMEKLADIEELHTLAYGYDMGPDFFKEFTTSALEDNLRLFLRSADAAIGHFNQAANTILSYYADGETHPRIVNCIRGRETVESADLALQLKTSLDQDWVREKTLMMVRGWQDSLKGMQKENKAFWWKRFPLAAKKYL